MFLETKLFTNEIFIQDYTSVRTDSSYRYIRLVFRKLYMIWIRDYRIRDTGLEIQDQRYRIRDYRIIDYMIRDYSIRDYRIKDYRVRGYRIRVYIITGLGITGLRITGLGILGLEITGLGLKDQGLQDQGLNNQGLKSQTLKFLAGQRDCSYVWIMFEVPSVKQMILILHIS